MAHVRALRFKGFIDFLGPTGCSGLAGLIDPSSPVHRVGRAASDMSNLPCCSAQSHCSSLHVGTLALFSRAVRACPPNTGMDGMAAGSMASSATASIVSVLAVRFASEHYLANKFVSRVAAVCGMSAGPVMGSVAVAVAAEAAWA